MPGSPESERVGRTMLIGVIAIILSVAGALLVVRLTGAGDEPVWTSLARFGFACAVSVFLWEARRWAPLLGVVWLGAVGAMAARDAWARLPDVPAATGLLATAALCVAAAGVLLSTPVREYLDRRRGRAEAR